MVTLLDCLNDLKSSLKLIDLEFIFLQFGPTRRRDRESMDSIFQWNLGPSCHQRKHKNITIYVRKRPDVVNPPLVVKQKSCLHCQHPTKHSVYFSLKFIQHQSELWFPFFKKRQLYQELHKLSDTLAAQPYHICPSKHEIKHCHFSTILHRTAWVTK